MSLEENRVKFADLASDRAISNVGNTFTALQDKKGGFKLLGSYACHGNLAGIAVDYYDYLFVNIRRTVTDRESVVRFIDFWINRSPVAKVFVEKDANRVYDECAIVDLNHESNLVGFALIGLRFCYENYNKDLVKRLSTYHRMVSLGYDEWESFVFAHWIEQIKEGWRWNPISSAHATIIRDVTQKYLRNLLTKTFHSMSKHTLSKLGSYAGDVGVTNLFSPADYRNSLYETFKRLRPKVSGKAKNYNLFFLHKNADDGVVWLGDEGLKEFVDRIKEFAEK